MKVEIPVEAENHNHKTVLVLDNDGYENPKNIDLYHTFYDKETEEVIYSKEVLTVNVDQLAKALKAFL